MKDGFTRKEFLDAAARSAVAVSVGAFGGSLTAAATDPERQVPILAKTVAQTFAWPWPYAALDPEDVRKRAHKAYYDGGCGYGAFSAMVSALADKVGEPFTLIPPQMLYFGSGGGAGWGTLCGALNGAGAAISLVVDRTNATSVISELFGWYTTAPFPSDTSNTYATTGQFLVSRYDKTLKQTVANSPLCHASVSNWCTESFFRSNSAERAERCARLTGDVAARAVDLVNAFTQGRFKASFAPASAVSECMGCHDTTSIGNVISTTKMDCRFCHNENFDHLY